MTTDASTTARLPRDAPSPRRRLLMLGALGVVFGDIGTSGLYALQTLFQSDGASITPTPVHVYGIISLIFWTLVVIVSVEFVMLIMRADNEGEGGVMALIALVKRLSIRRPWAKPAFVAAGLFGVALFFGDGMITPAISVLSAVEGLEVAVPGTADLVVPIALAILTGLFAAQRFGTAVIGKVFGPVMVLWFTVIGVAGLHQVAQDTTILRSMSPVYAVTFLVENPTISFIALGSIVLTITGTEALYADMGHFGRRAITRAWFWVVFPALVLNYMGQGSLLLQSPAAVTNPFFLLLPNWAQLPMVLLAMVATVIASQAVISGAFSVTNQAIRSGYLPRLSIRHTSNTEMGQVYAPVVNWALYLAVVVLVVVFQSSTRLASMYGIAVTGTLLIDTVLFLVVMRMLWRRPKWNVALAGVVFLTINVVFVAANLGKILNGGWFPLGIGVLLFTVMSTWYVGNQRVTARRLAAEGNLAEFVAALPLYNPPIQMVPGTVVILSPSDSTTPLAMRLGTERFHVLHERVILLTLVMQTEAHVDDAHRLTLEWEATASAMPTTIGVLHASFGFRDQLDVPHALELARDQGLIPDLNIDSVVYLVSHISVRPDSTPGMARWRKRLFTDLAKNATSPIEYFNLPPERTVALGTEVGV